MKFLVLGDPHDAVTKQPKNRTDNFYETFDKKVEEIKELAMKHEVKAILQTGDFLDVPRIGTHKLFEIIERWSVVPMLPLLAELQQDPTKADEVAKKMAKGIPLIGLIGNHELYSEMLSSYPKTSLSILEQMGFMKLLSKEEPLIFEENGVSVALTGTHYHSKIDTKEYVSDYVVDQKAADYHIHMVHGMLVKKSLGDLIKNTTVDQIADLTKADLTISGHDHIGFLPIEHDGKIFTNPGSLTRTKADLKEMNRKPKVLLVEITAQNGLTVKPIYLKSAQAGEDVLDRTMIVEQKNQQARMEMIKSTVNRAQVKQGLSMKTIVESIADANQIEETVKNDLVERITDKMKEFDETDRSNQQVEPYYVTKMVLTNFQSHSHSVFDFSNGLNIFVGESGNGKSAVLRAFDFVYNNSKKNPRDYIQVGKDYTEVEIHLSNGFIISRIVEKKKSGQNGYKIFNPHTMLTEEANTRAKDEIIPEILGNSKITYDIKKTGESIAKSELDVNFIKQGTSWFFIGDNLKGSERAKLIGSIFGTHYSDGVLRELEKEVNSNSKLMKVRRKDIEEINEKLESFDFIEELEEKLKQSEEKLRETNEKQVKLTRLKEIKSKIQEQHRQLEEIEIKLRSIPDLNFLNTKLNQLKTTVHTYQSIHGIHQRIKRTRMAMEENEETLNRVKNVGKMIEKAEKLGGILRQQATLIETRDRIRKVEQKREEIAERLKQAEAILPKFSRVGDAGVLAKGLEEKTTKLQLLKEKKAFLMEVVQKGKIQAQENQQLNQQRMNLVNQYVQEIKIAETCPTCQGRIDDAALVRIMNSFKSA